MNKKLYFLYFIFTFVSVKYHAQLSKVPVQEFATTAGTQEFYLKSITKTDVNKNVYVAGATLNGLGNYDMLLTKYSPAGAIIWVKQYAGAGNGNDAAVNFILDASFNVYVVGTVYTSATNNNDMLVIKYNSAGVQQWLKTYNGAASMADVGADIVIGNNNVFITGGVQTINGFTDYATIKYSSTGVFQWAKTYDYLGMYDGAQKITFTTGGNGTVTVAGGVQQSPNTWRFGVVSYDGLNGNQLNATISGGNASGIDQVNDITKDAVGNIYVTGSIVNTGTGRDMYTIKINQADLSTAWIANYNSTGSLEDISNGIAVDASNNVYVTGYSQSAAQGKNYTTIKYNSSGVQQWLQTYNGAANSDDEASAILFDNNFVYVTGTSKINGNKDYFTICYTNAGVKTWEIGYNGTNNKDDIASSMAIDNAKSIIVAGQSNMDPTSRTYTTVKYLQKDLYNPKPTIAAKGKAAYKENRGQVLNTNLTPNTTIKYYCDESYPSTYIDDNKISYLFSSLDTNETDSLHRVDMQFNKGFGNAKVYPTGLRNTFYNYYIGNMTRNGERTLAYNSIVKYGVYTNTDVIYTQNSRGYTHSIVARSGAPTANFEMQYTGQSGLTVDGLGNLNIATTLGTLKQPRAKAYTMNNTTGVLTLLGWQPTYVVTGGNKVTFTLGTWPAGSTLVIEMVKAGEQMIDFLPIANLGWSTYVGGNGYDVYLATKTDGIGFQYAAGFSTSPVFPAFGGGQGTNLSTYSAMWSKFDGVHAMKFSTFYGGNTLSGYTTVGTDIDVIAPSGDPSHAVFLVGYTDDSNLQIVPYSGADNDETMDGDGDGFIARFNNDGILSFARFFGGDGVESINSIDHDDNQNIYITGDVGDVSTNFPLLDIGGNGYYEGALLGNGDFFISKINSTLDLTWSTFYGGSTGYETPINLVFDKELNNFYVSGRTYSTDLPLSENYYDNTYGGFRDAFIIKFATNGVLLWGTYLGGGSYDGDYSDISIKSNNKLYFTTTSYSNDLYQSYNTVNWADNTYAGNGDLFILVLDLITMQPEWASYFGESQYEGSPVILCDNGAGFFLAGATGSGNYVLQDDLGVNYQQDYQQDDCGYGDESFLVHFYPSFQKDWLTYFGGDSSCTETIVSAENPQDMDSYYNGTESFLYMVGTCGNFENADETKNFPRVDYDGDAVVSYFDPIFNSGILDAFISMFRIPNLATNIDGNNSLNNTLFIYPNPAGSVINVFLINQAEKNLDLVICNNLGQIVHSHKNTSEGNNLIDISKLSSGQYLVLIKSKDLVIGTARFIKE